MTATPLDRAFKLELLLGPAGNHSMAGVPPDVLEQIRRLRQGDGRSYGAAWTEHETALLEFATRERLRPPGDSRYFFGQGVAARQQARAATLRARSAAQDAATARAVAAHEAAHLTCWIWYGLPATRADVVDGGGLAWLQMPGEPPSTEAPQARFDRIDQALTDIEIPEEWGLLGYAVGTAAGHLAAVRAGDDEATARAGAARDLDAIEILLGKSLGVPRHAPGVKDFARVVEYHADSFLAVHWPWVQRVASELLEHRTVTRERAIALLRPTKGTK